VAVVAVELVVVEVAVPDVKQPGRVRGGQPLLTPCKQLRVRLRRKPTHIAYVQKKKRTVLY
jgi:hypothetical protein